MLRHETEPLDSTWRHTPPDASPIPGRFDKNATQDILETASRLQQAEQNTLSQEEIEAMAAEMGISPRHIRQAITLSRRRTTSGRRFAPIRLSAQEKVVVVGTILLYSALMMSLFRIADTAGRMRFEGVFLFCLYVLPFLIAFWLGKWVGFKRAGAVSGGLLTTVMFIGVQILMALMNRGNLLDHGGVWYMLMITGGAAVAGVGGAVLEQWLHRGQLSNVPAAVKLSEQDR